MTRDRYDIAVLTVIQVEGEILSHWLKVAPASRIRRDGRIFHTANVFSEIHQRNLRVVVGCIGRASQADAALAAQFMFREFDPAVAVLCGIAAGLRGKVRIGDVVWSRQIVDLSQKVAQAGGYSERPGGALLHPLTQQMMANRRTDPALFLPGFAVRNGITIVPPAGKEAEYAEHVADAPTTHDAAIASADVLLRDGTMFRELLQLNQSIRAAEMEAGGFVKACQDGAKPRPWLVVRGISDFGDDFKDDAFHVLAAHSAAAFVSQFVRLAADIDLVRPQRARRSTVAQVQPSVGQTAGSNISSVSVSVAVTGVSSGIAAGSDTAGLRADFERARRDWKNTLSADALANLKALLAHGQWEQASRGLRADILRYVAVATLRSDPAESDLFAHQAEELAPATTTDPFVIRLLLEAQGPETALEQLAAPATTELWNLRLLCLVRCERDGDVVAEYGHPPASVTPDVESRRLYSWALLNSNRLTEALEAVSEPRIEEPVPFGIRLVRALIGYFQTLLPDYAARLPKNVPVPTDPDLLLVDPQSLAKLREVGTAFADLVSSGVADNNIIDSLQGWRLACLANDPERQAEAQTLCGELLDRDSPHEIALQWAMARGYAADLDAVLAAISPE